MNKPFIKGDNILNRFVAFYLIAVLFLWMKTYLSQLFVFNLGVEGTLQHFLLFINPIGSVMLFLGISFLFKGRRKYNALLVIYTLLTVLLYANTVYYREFTDFLTLPTIFSASNLGNMGGSITALLEPYDILYFIDILLLIGLLLFKIVKIETYDPSRRKIAAVISLALGISCLNLGIAESDRPELLTRGFDRNYIVKYLGMYNYTLYDAVQSTKASAQRVLADSSDITEIVNFTKSNYAEPNEKYFGIAKGRNVIYVHLESIQEFVIDYQLNGVEVTPFLNALKDHEDTIYFNNFFHQTAQGKTADAEFIIENSLYGLPQGAAFMTSSRNTYHAAPAILKDYGYTSAVFHGNGGGFWNRNEIYKSFGFDHFFDATYYDIRSEDLAQYGLMDKPFFEQSVEMLKELPEPFYTKFITVTNHHPYDLDPELATIEKHNTGNRFIDNYFQTVRYADEALEQFFNDLKEAGLYENSIFIMYGDHYGISQNHNEDMEMVIGKEIGDFESAGLQRVPLYIHIPGADIDGGIKSTYGGQIDLLPTLLHLLGINAQDYVHFGTDLLSENHVEIVPFRNGDFVGPEVHHIGGVVYDAITGEELDENDPRFEMAQELHDLVQYTLELSDNVVNGDLLRFYTPEGFTPVDRSQYNYKKQDEM